MNSYWSKIGIFLKFMRKASVKWKNWSDFKVLHSDTINFEEKIGRRSRHYLWNHCQDSGTSEWSYLHEWFERISRCWISTQWKFPRYQSTSVIPTSSNSWRNAQPFYRMPSRNKGTPSIWDTHGISGNFSCRSSCVNLSARYPQELNPWSSGISEPIHSSTAEKNENQTPVQDQRCYSRPSARNSLTPVKEILQRIMGQTNNDCRSQIFISTKSLRQQRSFVGR